MAEPARKRCAKIQYRRENRGNPPTITRERSSGHAADMEKILVDLLVEASDLRLMDEDEHFRILGNVLPAGRVDVGALLNYAKRRKLKTKGLIERIKFI